MTAADVWGASLWEAWVFAKGARAAELRGDRRAKLLDTRGLHPYSLAWGQVFACEELDPSLAARRDAGGHGWLVIGQEPAALGPLDPVSMRSIAARAAEQAFEQAARAGEDLWHHHG